jgi:hypothetical protein
MRSERKTYQAIRQQLLARASSLAVRVALRPRGWAPGLLAAGLIGTAAPALAQEIINVATDAELIIQGAAANDFSGISASGAGDVNGDGIDDLIVGAPGVDPNGRSNAGASYVVFGSDQGFPPIIDLATDADVTIQGAAANDVSGYSVSGAGDVNGDGIDDLIVGAPRADPNGRSYAGASYVVFGAADLAGTIDLADPASGADLIIQGAVAYDRSGSSVSEAGDINGDGIGDLIIGAYQADPNGRNYAGASYVVFGSDQGLPPTIDLATEADVTIQGAAADDGSGTSVSGAGDVNGDGIDDLIVGAPGADPNGRDGAGGSYVVFGAADLAGTIDLADPAAGADLIIQGAAYDFSGKSVSGAGDVNGDGIDDLLIGADQADPNGRRDAGASYVVFGSDQGFPPILDLATDANVTIQGAAVYDRSGFSVSGAGDVNGDGLDDLIIGALQPGSAEQEPRYAGASYVVFGTDQGFPATIDLASDADLTMVGAATNDQFGRSVSGAGDVDGDGLDDLIIGAPNNRPNGREGAGASYVVFGGPAAAIERLIARVEAADLQPGIEKILTETLSRALDDLNKGKTSRAIIALRVFIGEVKALRGGKIDAADADEWIADARAIIDTLKAQRDQHREPSPMVEAQE